MEKFADRLFVDKNGDEYTVTIYQPYKNENGGYRCEFFIDYRISNNKAVLIIDFKDLVGITSF